ncbi:hypothetical protein FSP39_015390 [Pinctada imbricata]|uniref:SAND domain-containing protein n=1 Tax=Pinctada imbricata TaxID=66713 RepID=A0AA88Y5H4_PINIB|nr:hypothetical protein FSP39_015390 [Pinctada imbricata]
MSEVDISEDIPNGDDSAFTDENQQNVSGDSSHGQEDGLPEHVFVATSQGLLSAEHFQEATGLKTTHIVIHDQSLNESGLKTPTTPLPPPTPATPLSRSKGFRYTWDSSVHHSNILPVRCKSTNGELHKSKFGSGGRGRCIKADGEWFTPNEFEARSGRASSKDWKRSIRYGGRTLQCLIEDGILQPHATSCTCAACCDDESVTGPVRLFVPYKRRKKDSETGPPSPTQPAPVIKKQRINSAKSPTSAVQVPAVTLASVVPASVAKEQVGMIVAGQGTTAHPIRVASAEGETVQIFTTDSAGNIITGDAVVMTPIPMTPKATNGGAASAVVSLPDVTEQRVWWQLEELANNLLLQAQQLKAMIEQAKQQSQMSRDAAVQQVRAHMEKEKHEALNTMRLESQMTLSRALIEERAQKDLAIQQAVASARADLQVQEKGDIVTVVQCDKVTYSESWGENHTESQTIEMLEVDADSDKEKD